MIKTNWITHRLWHLRIRPGLQHNGQPLTLWARLKIWIWLRRTERVIDKALRETGMTKEKK